MYQALETNPAKRGPYGAIWGDSDVGKTTSIAEAFPDYLYLITNAGALDNAFAWLSGQGKPQPQAAIKLIDKYDENGDPAVDWYTEIHQLFARMSHLSRQLREKTKKAGKEKIALPKKGTIPGLELPIFPRGVVISEATELFAWIDRDAKVLYGREYRTNDRIRRVLGMFSAWNTETGLGLILDMHGGPAEYDEHDTLRERPTLPEGPSFPFRQMRRDFHKPMDFVWRITNEGEGESRKLIVHTRSESTAHVTCKTRMKGQTESLDNVFTRTRSRVDLTSEGISARDLLSEAGYPFPKVASESSETPSEPGPDSEKEDA